MNEEEIQSQRKSWELEDHWQLRNTFMTIYCDAFPKDKLLCLAQAFVNVETLGVKYSPDLMEEIEKLAENVPGLTKYRAIKERRDVESAERKQEKKDSLKCSKNDRNDKKKYELDELFPVGSKCFILNEQYYGDIADIVEVQKKTNKVKVKIQRVAEPDLIEVKNRSYELMSKEYMTNHALAQRLSVNPCIVSRLTGTVMVEKSNGNKVNIGLNLKFNTRREYVPGYSQRRDETWLFSWKTLKLMEEYNSKFPELFINLSKLADQKSYLPEQIFNGPNAEDKISEVEAWLKTLPHQNAPRMKFDTEALDEVIVKCIEDVLNTHEVFANQYEPITLVYSSDQLYCPVNRIEYSPPDPNATFNLFDRVVNVREGISVPLGARGVIIGKTKNKQDKDTYLYDIVFDEPFSGGMSYNCSTERGYRLHPHDLINISYKKKKGSYGVREDFDMAPIQPTNMKQRDKKARQNVSSGYKKLINLSANHNREGYDNSNKQEYSDQENQNYNHRNKKQVISSPVQINHSPTSLFQSPNHSYNSSFSLLSIKTMNQESSPPEGSACHMMSTASVSSSLPESGCMTGNDLVEMCKNMELKQTENCKSAISKLDEWCLSKFGIKPVYDISRVGPGHIILPFVKVILPNKDEFGFPSNSFESPDKMFEICAAMALRSLKIDDTNVDLSLIQPPALPPPPLKWFDHDESRTIPESFVAENHQILDRVKEEQKTKQSTSSSPPNQQYQHQYQNPQQNSYQQYQQHQQQHFTHQQNHHYQVQSHDNLNTRNSRHRGNQQFEGPIMTNRPVAMSRPFSMQIFSSQPHPQKPETSYGEQQQQQQVHRPFPRPMQGPRPNKFIPVQVERNKQNPREISQNKKGIQDVKRSLAHDNRTEHRKNEMIDYSPRLSEHTESGKKSLSRRRSRVLVGIGSKHEPAE